VAVESRERHVDSVIEVACQWFRCLRRYSISHVSNGWKVRGRTDSGGYAVEHFRRERVAGRDVEKEPPERLGVAAPHAFDGLVVIEAVKARNTRLDGGARKKGGGLREPSAGYPMRLSLQPQKPQQSEVGNVVGGGVVSRPWC
jgi:hypothetical protein